MSKTPTAVPWPRCPKCKGGRVGPASSVETWPPDPVTARCDGCGHVWSICGAKNRAGARCGKNPTQNGRCVNHGGKSTGRPVLHGRRSKYLPVRLQERAEQALADRELVSLGEDLALTDALITERYERLGDESHAHLWSLAIGCLSELEGCASDGTLTMDERARQMFDRLRSVVENGQGCAQAEKEIIGLQEHKRKLSDTEIKRQVALNQYVSAKELNVLLALILNAIRETVKDPGERLQIGSKIASVVRPVLGERVTKDASGIGAA